MTELDDDNPCAECGGMCCSFREMTISYRSLDEGERYDSFMLDHDDVDQLALADGSAPDMDWFVVTHPNGDRTLNFECNHRDDDGLCGVYDDRPGMCESFECAVLRGEETLAQYKERVALPDGRGDEYAVRDVTERVTDILDRRLAGETDD